MNPTDKHKKVKYKNEKMQWPSSDSRQLPVGPFLRLSRNSLGFLIFLTEVEEIILIVDES